MNIVNVRDTSEICQYSYGILSVYLCRTFGARGLHYRCQGAALFLALLEAAVFREFTHDVSIAMVYCRYTYAGLLVPDSRTLGTRQLDFSGTIILKSLQWLFWLSRIKMTLLFTLFLMFSSES